MKCAGTRLETRFRLSAKRTSPFKSAGTPVQSTSGSRGVRISGSNAGYTMFRGSVKSTGYPLHSPVSPSLPSLLHQVPSHFNWTLFPRTLLFVFLRREKPPSGPWSPHSRGFYITHDDVPQSTGLPWTSDQLVAETST